MHEKALLLKRKTNERTKKIWVWKFVEGKKNVKFKRRSVTETFLSSFQESRGRAGKLRTRNFYVKVESHNDLFLGECLHIIPITYFISFYLFFKYIQRISPIFLWFSSLYILIGLFYFYSHTFYLIVIDWNEMSNIYTPSKTPHNRTTPWHIHNVYGWAIRKSVNGVLRLYYTTSVPWCVNSPAFLAFRSDVIFIFIYIIHKSL